MRQDPQFGKTVERNNPHRAPSVRITIIVIGFVIFFWGAGSVNWPPFSLSAGKNSRYLLQPPKSAFTEDARVRLSRTALPIDYSGYATYVGIALADTPPFTERGDSRGIPADVVPLKTLSSEMLLQLEELQQAATRWAPCPFGPEERRLLEDCRDRQLDDFSFFQATLVACGISSRDLRPFEEILDRHVRAVRNLVREARDELSGIREIFRYLHREVLTGGYQIDATNPAVTLETGRYNCVSAAILFKLLAEAAGYPVRIQQLPTHAFCRVETTFASIPVECTSPRWFDSLTGLSSSWPEGFDPVGKPARTGGLTSSSGNLISTSRVAEREWQIYDRGRTISETQLVGTLYYNRGVDALFARRFDQALYANIVAVRLDPTNESAKDNLLASLNNWAIALAEAGQFAQAAERLHWALRCAPSAKPVQTNLIRLYRQWHAASIKQGHSEEFKSWAAHAVRELSSSPQAEPVVRHLEQLLTE